MERSGVAEPILLGRPDVIERRVAELGLRFRPTVVDPQTSDRLEAYADELYRLRRRKGLTRTRARRMVEEPNIFGMMMVHTGDADCFLGGLDDEYPAVVRPALQLIGRRPGVETVAGVYLVIARDRAYFFADGLVNIDPNADRIADIAILTADFVRTLGIEPNIATVSFSNFGSVRHPEAEKMRLAVDIVRDRRPDLCIDGEMQADTALAAEIVDDRYSFSRVRAANVLIFPNLDASTAAFKVLSRLGEGDVVGPALVGTNASVHPLHPASEVRDINRMAALAVLTAAHNRG
jgi:malate dehydrogenase (oxaloacetate-decarboxylating)(NADP+)